MLAADWGWWRTVTGNLAKLPGLLSSQPGLAPPYPRFDAADPGQAAAEVAETVPKGLKWKPGRTSATGSAGTNYPKKSITDSRPAEPVND